MRVNNQTSDPVDWEQNGGSPNEEEVELCSESGHLDPGEKSDPFEPCGMPPYVVSFVTSSTTKPVKTAQAEGILDPDAQVVVVSFPLVI